jgi:hypothetical protein
MMKHFVLTNVGSLNDKVVDEYHKISKNYNAGNRSYEDKNGDYSETFINKMLKKTAYNPSVELLGESEEKDLAREDYKTSLMTRLAKREINQKHHDQI